MWMIEHVLAIHGVTASTPIVVYDEQSGVRAARAFWFLEYFGHPSVRVLDGGFGAWSRAGLPASKDSAPAPASDWTGSREERTLATWREVKAAIGRRDAVILDARSDGEYLWHHGAREARWRGTRCGPRRVDAEPRPGRRVQAGGRTPGDVRGRWRHARIGKCSRIVRAATVRRTPIWPCGCSGIRA